MSTREQRREQRLAKLAEDFFEVTAKRFLSEDWDPASPKSNARVARFIKSLSKAMARYWAAAVR
jgi:hypothetical protein